MKVFQNSIIIVTTLLLIISTNVFVHAQPYNPALENQFGSTLTTKLFHDNAVLILNQTADKSSYRMGEGIVVNDELINIGNSTVKIKYCEPWAAFEIKNQTGAEMWPKSQMGCIPQFIGKATLLPGDHFRVTPWETSSGHVVSPPSLDAPGTYTIISVAAFTFDSDFYGQGQVESLWSKPLQITVLPEKVPEFPIALLIMLIGVASAVVFYKIKPITRVYH